MRRIEQSFLQRWIVSDLDASKAEVDALGRLQAETAAEIL